MVVLVLYGSGSILPYLLVAKETHDIMCTYHMYMPTEDKECAPNNIIVYVCGLCMYIVQGYKKKDSYIACQGML